MVQYSKEVNIPIYHTPNFSKTFFLCVLKWQGCAWQIFLPCLQRGKKHCVTPCLISCAPCFFCQAVYSKQKDLSHSDNCLPRKYINSPQVFYVGLATPNSTCTFQEVILCKRLVVANRHTCTCKGSNTVIQFLLPRSIEDQSKRKNVRPGIRSIKKYPLRGVIIFAIDFSVPHCL